MESITLSVELVLPDWDCPGSTAEGGGGGGLIDHQWRRLRGAIRGGEKRKEQECGYLEVKGGRGVMRMCEGGGVIGLISPVCLSSLGSRSGSISRPGARLQPLMQLLPTLHGYLQESAVVWWSAILVIIASLEGMNEQRGEGNFLFGSPLLLPAYKCAVKICYIVFIHAENLLLGPSLWRRLFAIFLSFLRFCCLVLSIVWLILNVCVCAARLSAAFVPLCFKVPWDLFSFAACLTLPQVCVIVGRLAGALAANRATLARLCVYETAGMCSVPPGRGR